MAGSDNPLNFIRPRSGRASLSFQDEGAQRSEDETRANAGIPLVISRMLREGAGALGVQGGETEAPPSIGTSDQQNGAALQPAPEEPPPPEWEDEPPPPEPRPPIPPAEPPVENWCRCTGFEVTHVGPNKLPSKDFARGQAECVMQSAGDSCLAFLFTEGTDLAAIFSWEIRLVGEDGKPCDNMSLSFEPTAAHWSSHNANNPEWHSVKATRTSLSGGLKCNQTVAARIRPRRFIPDENGDPGTPIDELPQDQREGRDTVIKQGECIVIGYFNGQECGRRKVRVASECSCSAFCIDVRKPDLVGEGCNLLLPVSDQQAARADRSYGAMVVMVGGNRPMDVWWQATSKEGYVEFKSFKVQSSMLEGNLRCGELDVFLTVPSALAKAELMVKAGLLGSAATVEDEIIVISSPLGLCGRIPVTIRRGCDIEALGDALRNAHPLQVNVSVDTDTSNVTLPAPKAESGWFSLTLVNATDGSRLRAWISLQWNLASEFEPDDCCCVYIKSVEVNVVFRGNMRPYEVQGHPAYRAFLRVIENDDFGRKIETKLNSLLENQGISNPSCINADPKYCEEQYRAYLQWQLRELRWDQAIFDDALCSIAPFIQHPADPSVFESVPIEWAAGRGMETVLEIRTRRTTVEEWSDVKRIVEGLRPGSTSSVRWPVGATAALIVTPRVKLGWMTTEVEDRSCKCTYASAIDVDVHLVAWEETSYAPKAKGGDYYVLHAIFELVRKQARIRFTTSSPATQHVLAILDKRLGRPDFRVCASFLDANAQLLKETEERINATLSQDFAVYPGVPDDTYEWQLGGHDGPGPAIAELMCTIRASAFDPEANRMSFEIDGGATHKAAATTTVLWAYAAVVALNMAISELQTLIANGVGVAAREPFTDIFSTPVSPGLSLANLKDIQNNARDIRDVLLTDHEVFDFVVGCGAAGENRSFMWVNATLYPINICILTDSALRPLRSPMGTTAAKVAHEASHIDPIGGGDPFRWSWGHGLDAWKNGRWTGEDPNDPAAERNITKTDRIHRIPDAYARLAFYYMAKRWKWAFMLTDWKPYETFSA